MAAASGSDPIAAIGRDQVHLLWYIPISDAELLFKCMQGTDKLLNRMEAADLPWLFEEANRPPLV